MITPLEEHLTNTVRQLQQENALLRKALGLRNVPAPPIEDPLSAVVNEETVTDDQQDKIIDLKRRIARGEAMLRSLTRNPTTYSNAVMESVISEIEHQKFQLETLEQRK